MWQELRDYWLPMMLFAGSLLVAGVLFLLVAVMPFVSESPFAPTLLDVFASDGTVRRSAIVGAIGLIVTAFVFFRPTKTIAHAKAPRRKEENTRLHQT